MLLKRLIAELNAQKIKYALAGGYAVALHGAVRGTVDVDILVTLDERSLSKVEAVMHSLGLTSKIPVSAKEIANFRKEYIEQRNLKAWSFVNVNFPIEVVDILILYDLADFKTVTKNTAFGSVNVVAIDDLIRMKELAGRDQDLEDVKALKQIKRQKK